MRLSLFFVLCFFSIVTIGQVPRGPVPPIMSIAEIALLPATNEKVIQTIRAARNPRLPPSIEVTDLLDEAFRIATQLNQAELITGVLSAQGIVQLNMGNSDRALDLLKQAEQYIDKIPESRAVSLFMDLTRIYSRSGQNNKALIYHDKIENICKGKAELLIPRILNIKNKANIYLREQDHQMILACYKQALKLSEESNNSSLLKDTRFSYVIQLINMHKDDEAFQILKDLVPDLDNSFIDRSASFFSILSKKYRESGNLKNALIYSRKLFGLPNASAHDKSEGINQSILAAYDLREFKNMDADFAAHKKWSMDNNSLYSKKAFQLAEARYYHYKGNKKLAKSNYLKTIKLKHANQLQPNYDVEASIGLAELYSEEDNADSSNFHLDAAGRIVNGSIAVAPAIKLKYNKAVQKRIQPGHGQDSLVKSLRDELQVKDTLHNMRLSDLTNDIEARYRISEKEKQLLLVQKQQQLQQMELKQQKQQSLLITLGLTFALVILIGIVYLFYQRRKQSAKLYTIELNGLKNEHRLQIMNALTESREQESKRIAERLHDEVGAMLSIANLNINTLRENVFSAGSGAEEKLEVTQKLMSEISHTVRNISHTLMPIALEKYGLKSAIEDLVANIKTSDTLKVEHLIEGLDDTMAWPQTFTLSVYRIIQEILNNVIKHASASHLFIQLIELENSITIYIEDNGKGLSKESTESNGAGMKLLRSSIDYLSGRLEIQGEPNNGTFALIELPIPNNT